MRLIDADAFMEYLGLEDTKENREENVGEIVTLEDFDRQSVAFDKEKVIEELRQEAMYELGVPEDKFNADESEYSSYCAISFAQANKIVEKGGIE